MRILQLSDPHLLADLEGLVRERPALSLWQRALAQVRQTRPDLLLVTGDLCQDESWGGYGQLRDSLTDLPAETSVALVAGNHDQPTLLRAALGRQAVVGPAEIVRGQGRLLLLSSHLAGQCGGGLGTPQLRWLEQRLNDPLHITTATLVALHHPPLPIGDPGLDRIGLRDGEALISLLQRAPALKAVLFGHIHQHWQGRLPGRADVALLACPSTLKSFQAVQPCPLGRPDDPGGRWLDLKADGALETSLLRWS